LHSWRLVETKVVPRVKNPEKSKRVELWENVSTKVQISVADTGRLWKAVKATAETERLRGTKDYLLFQIGVLYYFVSNGRDWEEGC
jgi:hypothetical protein